MGHWGIQPSEFWDMDPEQWWWLYDAKRTDHPKNKGVGLDDEELAELYELIS